MTAVDRFLDKTSPEPNSGCWLWTGAVMPNGYGAFKERSYVRVLAHRFAYEKFIGPIPTGMEIDHKCRVRCCVNPDHMEAVTHQVNMRRGGNAMKTKCLNGHPFVEGNFVLAKTGARKCLLCRRAPR